MAERPYIAPYDTLSVEEDEGVGAVGLREWPANLKNLAISFESAEFIRNLAVMFSLDDTQQRGVARCTMELVLGNIPTTETASELSRIAGVDTNTAIQIIKELENGLLSPLGLTLSGLAAPPSEPAVVVTEEGREALRYATVDDLLGDIADLSPSDRDKFLVDAKADNRIIVLQALSQLKLGSDSGGRPLSFRQLIAAEAEDFSVSEWMDLARTDPDALVEPDVWRHIAATPLGAMLQGRDPSTAHSIVLQFAALDDESGRIAVDPSSAVAVQELVRGGLVPATHATAIGRIVFFVLTGQAAPRDVAGLLQKVGLNAVAADAAARTVASLTASVVVALPEDIAPPAPVAPAVPRNPGLNVPNALSRTIIDLRKPQP